MYKLYVNKMAAISKTVKRRVIIPVTQDYHNDFEPVDESDRLIPKTLTFIDALNLFRNGVEIIFVDHEKIPEFYEEVLDYVAMHESRDRSLRNPAVLDTLYDLGDHLYERHHNRLKIYFFKKEFNVDYKKFDFGKVKLEDITFNRITRKG